MKKKLATVALASMVASGTLFGADAYFGMSYANIADSANSANSFTANSGIKFGQTWKQRVGMELIADSGETNGMIDFYYTLGYEVLQDFVVAGSVGYGFEDIGSIGNQEVYATGVGYGVSLSYDFTRHIEMIAEYKTYDLTYTSLDYSRDVMTVGLVYVY
jgi:hypothetical protein